MSKKILLLFSVFQFSTCIFLQSTEVDLGNINPEQCRSHVAKFQAKFNEYTAEKNIEHLKEAKKQFELSLEFCPKYSENNYFRAKFMMEELLRDEKDVSKREILLDDTFKILDAQLKNFEGSNRTDIGYIFGLKGRLLFQYNKENTSKKFTIQTTKLQQAMEWMQKAIHIKRQSTDPLVINALFQAKLYAYKLSEKEKESFKTEKITQESLINDYVLFAGYLDAEIEDLEKRANEANPEKGIAENLKLIQRLKIDLQNNFLEIASCKDLETAASKSIQSNPNSKMRWEEIMRLSKCHKGNFYIKIAEETCNQNKTIDCYGGLVLAYLDSKNIDNAFKNVQKIVSLCADCAKEKEYKDWAMKIAIEAGQFSEAKRYGAELKIDPFYIQAREFAGNAASCSRRIDQKAAYWLAYDAMRKAVQNQKNDEERKKLEKFLVTYQNMFPDNEEIFNEGLKQGEKFSVRCFSNTEPVLIRAKGN